MVYYFFEFGLFFMLKGLEVFVREKEYEDSVLRIIFDNVGFDDVQEIEYQGVRGLFIFLEQEEVLVVFFSKRSFYFYLYFEELEIYFGVFVFEKKEYFDMYSRLVQFVRELLKLDLDKEDYQVYNIR